MNDALMEAADVRVKEIVTNFSHTRPDGRKAKTAAKKQGLKEATSVRISQALPIHPNGL